MLQYLYDKFINSDQYFFFFNIIASLSISHTASRNPHLSYLGKPPQFKEEFNSHCRFHESFGVVESDEQQMS